MIEDIFEFKRRDDLEHQSKMQRIKEEKDLDADEIKRIIKEKVGDKFLITFERNPTGYNNSPFDVVIGEERTLNMAGLEIKSDKDDFTRLTAQLRSYYSIFNHVYIVLHKKKAPAWLPSEIGILRVFEDGSVVQEQHSWMHDPLEISTNYEWDALFRENGLGVTSKQTKDTLRIVMEVRRNILFNRFFAESAGFNTKKFNKFWPFTEKQKAVIMGFDIPYHYKMLSKEVVGLEKKLVDLKKAIAFGQKTMEDFDAEKNNGEDKQQALHLEG